VDGHLDRAFLKDNFDTGSHTPSGSAPIMQDHGVEQVSAV
jgi:hypothetical protein